MSVFAPPATDAARIGRSARRLRLCFLGAPGWLDSCSPERMTGGYCSHRLPILEGADVERVVREVVRFGPHVTIIFDPACLPAEALRHLPGVTLGVVTTAPDGLRDAAVFSAASALDRVLSFRPELTGVRQGAAEIWRAVPPPVNDALFGEVRPLHVRPQALTVGRSTEYREQLLLPAKHHHDLLQVIHGVGGEAMIELLREYDVGIYTPPEPRGGFGPQPLMHMAAGQLLVAHRLKPAHGLEQGIDYLPFDSAQHLVWILDRLSRFPEMHQRVRLRGRLKAERYRASKLFARVSHDLLADVAAFGSDRR